MKSKTLQRTETYASLLLLTLLLACKPAKDAVAQQPAPPAAVATAAAPAAGMVRYDAVPSGSEMVMEGTSTLHDWNMKSLILGGHVEADAKFPEAAATDAEAAHPIVQVSIPVRSFKSNSKAMDERMQKDMKEPQFKKIEYKLIELKPKAAAGATGPLQFDAIGTLTIAGKTRTNSMPVTIQKVEGTKLKVTGSTQVKMTDYGIAPPTFLAALKTGDDVKLKFTWVAVLKAP